MRSAAVQSLLLIAAPMAVALSMLSDAKEFAAPANAAATTSPTSMRAIAPAFAAIAYYDQNCAHCHGPQGSFYGPTLGQKLTDEQLIKVVSDMASGPGNAPLTADQLLVETAFHRALIMRKPFVSVTQMSGGQWAGEATPDAKVTLVLDSQQIEARHDDATWSVQLPGVDPSKVQIVAELNGATTTLKLSDESYSNGKPIPAPSQRPK